MPRLRVWITWRFEAMHCWPAAPAEFAWLAMPHRHEFHARAEFDVREPDRELEFIRLKRQAIDLTATQARNEESRTWSCEHWCLWLLDRLRATAVEVSEDGENGARVDR